MKEFRMLQSELPAGIICTPKHESLDRYEARIDGPPDTPYEGGRFLVDVSLSDRYPIEPPSVKFKTRIYHPNIDDFGNICLEVLKSGKNGSWNPSWTVGKVLVALTVLLGSPNPHDPLMPEIAEQMRSSHATYIKTAKEWTMQHAMVHEEDPTDYVNGSQLSTISPASRHADQSASTEEPEPQAEPAKGKRKLGLSRKSVSPSPDQSLPGLPAQGKLPGTGGIRRLGLSRSKKPQTKRPPRPSPPATSRTGIKPLALTPRASKQPAASSGSSQTESIEITSDDASGEVMQSKKERLRPTRSSAGPGLSRLLGSKKLKRSRPAQPPNSSSQLQAAGSSLATTGESAEESECGMDSANVDEQSQLQGASAGGLLSLDDTDEAVDYDCLLSTEDSTGKHNSLYQSQQRQTPDNGSSNANDAVGDALEAIPEAMLSSSQLTPNIPATGPHHAELSAMEAKPSSQESSSGITIELGEMSSDIENPSYSASKPAKIADCSKAEQQKPSKGKAVDYSRPAPGDADGGRQYNEQILDESFFGPLDLGLPPVRVSAQRKLMRRHHTSDDARVQNGNHSVDVSQPQFTWRAVIVGLLFGTVLCFSNLWFGLQSGWISMMSLQASLVGFAVFKALERVLSIPFGPAENVILQTTAVATATMPLAGGFVGILPALKMLDSDEANGARTELNFGQLCAWGMALTFFGVFFAVPLRRQMVIKEKLRFPSGTATAQMISVLHKRPDPTLDEEPTAQSSGIQINEGGARLRRQESASAESIDADDSASSAEPENSSVAIAKADSVDDVQWAVKLVLLCVSFLMSGGYALLAHFFPAISALPVFGSYLSENWAWNLMPSLSYAGQGIIMGLPTCIWMLAGAVAGWGILSPLAKAEGWAPGPVTDWKTGSRGWILWVSLAVMIAESTISLGIVAFKETRALYYRLRHYRRVAAPTDDGAPQSQDLNMHAAGNQELDEVDGRFLVPNWITWGGLVASTCICMGIVKALFDVPVYDTLIAVALALPLAVLGVRALGETDLNPVSGIGKVSQVVFAGVMPGNLVGNLIAGGIAEAGAQQAGDLMQDLKTGHLLSASPRAQFAGQMIGSVFSVFITAGAYLLYSKVYDIPGPQFPVPTAQVWLDMARLVNGHPLPPHVWPFIIGFALLFVALPIGAALLNSAAFAEPVCRRLAIKQATLQRWWPSGIAFAMGIYNAPNFTLMRAIGAIFVSTVSELLVARSKRIQRAGGTEMSGLQESLIRRRIGILAIIMASGFVLGEGTFSFFILLSQAFS
ncbi:OPT super [Coemansia sp. RSA 2336]|nr:OPT super [Coemansia sp. RSA 2336]